MKSPRFCHCARSGRTCLRNLVHYIPGTHLTKYGMRMVDNKEIEVEIPARQSPSRSTTALLCGFDKLHGRCSSNGAVVLDFR